MFLLMISTFSLSIGEVIAQDHPRCRTAPVNFDPGTNDTVNVSTNTSKEKPCSHYFITGGLMIINSVTISQKPKKGRLDRVGEFQMIYSPPPGFVGMDEYTLKLCGSSPQGKGCTTAIYSMKVAP
jgi:hypothetical protein